MKKTLLFFFCILALSATLLAQTTTENASNNEVLYLKQSSHDFGKIIQGRPVTHVFELVNKGTEELRIENVQASCGCTTPEWSYTPVKPGGSTTLKVGYNSAAEGVFNKSVTIFYNGGKTKSIIITGNVFKAAPTSAPSNGSLSLLKQVNQ